MGPGVSLVLSVLVESRLVPVSAVPAGMRLPVSGVLADAGLLPTVD